MKCHNCGSEPEDGVLFCRDCGSKVEAQKKRFCRECGSTLSDGVKFCGNCGASVEFVANTPSQDEAAPTAKDKSAQVNPSMPEAASQIPNTQNNVNTAFENVKSAAARTQGKGKLIIGAVAAIVVILIVIGIGGMGSSSTGQTPSASQPSNAEPTNYTIEKGSQYAYMTDEWNVYIATAVSDSIVKIEHWGKTMSTDEKVGTSLISALSRLTIRRTDSRGSTTSILRLPSRSATRIRAAQRKPSRACSPSTSTTATKTRGPITTRTSPAIPTPTTIGTCIVLFR